MREELSRADNRLHEAIQNHSQMVYRLAYARTRNRPDAEDIYQEVFLRFATHEIFFQSAEHQKAWLIRATVNLSINLLRSAWRRRMVPADMSMEREQPAAEMVSDSMNLALDRLPARYRAVIHLFYFEDMSVDEIAKALDMKPSSIRTRLTRGRQRLKTLLTSDGEEVESE